MIIEIATLSIRAEALAAFEGVLAAAAAVFARAEGCLGFAVRRCIEDPTRYEAEIRWRRLEDHTVTFRQGPLFAEWRALVGPHFAAPPQVFHYSLLD